MKQTNTTINRLKNASKILFLFGGILILCSSLGLFYVSEKKTFKIKEFENVIKILQLEKSKKDTIVINVPQISLIHDSTIVKVPVNIFSLVRDTVYKIKTDTITSLIRDTLLSLIYDQEIKYKRLKPVVVETQTDSFRIKETKVLDSPFLSKEFIQIPKSNSTITSSFFVDKKNYDTIIISKSELDTLMRIINRHR